ncbi:unnamed protein product [Musa acuminata subsp. burmannicoides]
MGRQPCCDKVGLKKGPWTTEEDKRLINFMLTNGQCCWRVVPKLSGLLRCGKSCRLRWTNYLRPDLKRGLLSEEEEKMVIELHSQLGNRWSRIASHLRGRTDNEIKNHWNTHIKKKLRKMGIDPLLHKPLIPSASGVPHQEQQQAGALAERMEEQKPCSGSSSETAAEGQVEENIPSTASDAFLSKSPGFCTDEVPMILPHDILASCASTPTASSSISTSSTCSFSSSSSKAAEIQLPCMEWPESTYLWGLDDLNGWDFIFDRRDEELGLDHFSQWRRTASDHETWNSELF